VPAGPLAGSGLAVGDVIVEVDQQPVAGPDELSRRLAAAEESAGRSALLLLYRDYEHRFQTLALD
jgi:S1-C subfamily serine protease